MKTPEQTIKYLKDKIKFYRVEMKILLGEHNGLLNSDDNAYYELLKNDIKEHQNTINFINK
jgi:hypothetical protein